MRKIYQLLPFFLFAFISIPVLSQNQNIVWNKVTPNPSEFVLKDHENNLISVAGWSYGSVGNKVTKFTSDGNILWSTSFTGAGDFASTDPRVAIDTNNDIYLTLSDFDDTDQKAFLKIIKISSSGSIVWERRYLNAYGAEFRFTPRALVLDSQNNLYICGQDVNASPFGALLLKYNSNGDFQWKKVIVGSMPDGLNNFATCVAIDNSDNVIVTGNLDMNPFLYIGTSIMHKYDGNGNLLWQIQEGNSTFFAHEMLADNSGNIIVTGENRFILLNNDVRTVKYDASGVVVWDTNYKSNLVIGDNGKISLLKGQNEDLVVVSGYRNPADNTQGYKVVNYDHLSGQILWESLYAPNPNSGSYTNPSAVSIDDTGNISITGTTFDVLYNSINYPTNIRVATIKYKADGATLWTHSFPMVGIGHPPTLETIGDATYLGTYATTNNASTNGRLIKYSNRSVFKFYSGNFQGPKSTEVLIPIKADNFANGVGVQFSVNWDPSVATFLNVEGFGLNGVNGNSFGTSQSSSGGLTFSWSDPQSQTLASESTVFAIRFALTGDYGATTPLIISGQPLSMEVSHLKDGNFVLGDVGMEEGIISIDPLTFGGRILYSNSEPVQSVDVFLSGDQSSFTYTNETGDYFFSADPLVENGNYLITPSKQYDPEPMNGIDVQDIASIRRHILGTELFDSPYKIIASDINNSRTISTFDIVLMQGLILGITYGFPEDRQWVFVPSDYDFPSESNPFPYPQEKLLTQTELETNLQHNFVAIKLGDVNISRDNSQSDRTLSEEVTIDILQELIVSEDANEKIIEIPIRVKNFDEISAYQFSVSWDQEKLEFIEVIAGETSSTFGEHKVAEGMLTIVWDDVNGNATSLSDEAKLFTLKFKTHNEGSYNNVNITNSGTPVKVFDKNLKLINHNITWSERSSEDYKAGINAYPVPFDKSLSIEYHSPKEGPMNLSITDAMGRKVLQNESKSVKGKNVLTWNGLDDNGGIQKPGIYIVTLKSGFGVSNIKVIKK